MESIKLSAIQIDLMRILWTSGQASTSDIHKAIQCKRPLAYTTVATMLKRLNKRGLIEQTQSGRELMFTHLVDESQVKRSMVSGLLSDLFHGDPEALVAHLVSESELEANDLNKIGELIKKSEKQHDQ